MSWHLCNHEHIVSGILLRRFLLCSIHVNGVVLATLSAKRSLCDENNDN